MKLEILRYYIIIVNIIAFIIFFIDKRNAIKRGPRIRNKTLLSLAFIGGSIGALAAMYLFRHKTRKVHFAVGIPIITIMQIAAYFL